MHRTSVTNRSPTSKLIIDYPWTKDIEDITHLYNVDEEVGLSEERVREGFERYGPNGKSSVYIYKFY